METIVEGCIDTCIQGSHSHSHALLELRISELEEIFSIAMQSLSKRAVFENSEAIDCEGHVGCLEELEGHE